MKFDPLLILSAVPALSALFLSVTQFTFVVHKHYLFITDYQRRLCQSTTDDSVFRTFYMLSGIVLLFLALSLFLKLSANKVLRTCLRVILLVAAITSITASLWLYDMHKKHTLVGYQERFTLLRQQNN